MGASIKLHQKRRAYVDIESTGLDPSTHEIVEIAILYDDGGYPLVMKLKPEHLDRASPEALKINGYTPLDWAQAVTQAEAAREIEEHLMDCVFLAYNAKFDAAFVSTLLQRFGRRRMDHHVVDVAALAYEHLAPLGLPSLKLKTVCEFLGIPPESDIHRAETGAYLCRQVYRTLARAGWPKRLGWWWRNRVAAPGIGMNQRPVRRLSAF